MKDIILNDDGNNGDHWTHGITTFTCLCVVILMKIYNDSIYHNIVTLLSLLIATIFFFVFYTLASDSIFTSEAQGAVGIILKSPLFYLTVFFCFVASFIVDSSAKALYEMYYPDARSAIRKFAAAKRLPTTEEEDQFYR